MTTRIAVAALTALILQPATAQDSSNRVAAATDWAVFVENDPEQECWGVSKPKQMANTRDGRTVQVRRGDTLLFVAFRPDSGAEGEVAFTGGYPFRQGSTVTLAIGDRRYDLFTEGEWAWPAGDNEDAEIVAAMKNGTEAVLVGVSGRGTRTEDTFSLMGFTEAMTEAEARCSGQS